MLFLTTKQSAGRNDTKKAQEMKKAQKGGSGKSNVNVRSSLGEKFGLIFVWLSFPR